MGGGHLSYERRDEWATMRPMRDALRLVTGIAWTGPEGVSVRIEGAC